MGDVAVEVGKTIVLGNTNSDFIQKTFFGANFLLGRDSFSGTFEEKLSDMNVTLLRYPGGGIAEKNFDINNPNDVPVSLAGTFEGLSSFLAAAASSDITPVIVIPTKTYLDSLDQGTADLANFIERLNNGEFGNPKGIIFEIGNEYYVNNSSEVPSLTASEYGKIATSFVTTITDLATFNPKIAIQTGRTLDQNLDIISEFKASGELPKIDILVYHDYFWTGEAVAGRTSEKWSSIEQWNSTGISPEVFVSEWNVGSSSDPTTDAAHDYGLAQAAAMVEFVSEAVKAGVDLASVWAVQQNNKTSLTENEGNPTVNFGGEIFRMMSESLIGKQTLEISNDVFDSELVNYNAFESDSEVVIFVSASDFNEIENYLNLNLNLSSIGDGFSHVWAERLTTDGDPSDWRSKAITEKFSPQLTVETDLQLSLNFTTDFEIVKIVLEKNNPGTNAMTIYGFDTDEFLFAGDGKDSVFGRAGNDEIRGGRESDLIDGGAGDDTLFGGQGTDKLIGGEGDDTMFGGTQVDRLRGKSGNDFLYGERGNDKLIGGPGNDVLTGGVGADTFIFKVGHGNDKITDFELGVDNILFRGVDQNSVNQYLIDGQLEISYDGGLIELSNISNFLLSDDFAWT